MDRFGGNNNQNNDRFDLSGNNFQGNQNYPAPPPPPHHNDTSINGGDSSRFDLSQPLMNNNQQNYPPPPMMTNNNQPERFDLSPHQPTEKISFPQEQTNQNQGNEYVKPQLHFSSNEQMEKGYYESNAQPVYAGNANININVGLPPMENYGMGMNFQNPQNQQQQPNVNLPQQNMYVTPDSHQQNNQNLNTSNVNLPSQQNYIPGQPMMAPNNNNNNNNNYNNNYNNPNPQLQAQQFMVKPQQGYNPPPPQQHPMGAPIMVSPNSNYAQGQPINGQQYQQTLVMVQRPPAQNPNLPTNLDHCQYPAGMLCPSCQRSGVSTIVNSTGAGAFTMCLLGCFCCGPCGLIFLCMDNFQDKLHHCPHCGFQVGHYRYNYC